MHEILHGLSRSITVLTPIAWPVVVIFILLCFRKQIVALLGRLKGFRGFGLETVTLDFSETRGLAAEFKGNIRDFLPSGNWASGCVEKKSALYLGPEKSDAIYFFSHDLMLCYASLLTGAESEIILHTLNAAIRNIERFAADTPHHQALIKLLKQTEKYSDTDWTEKCRTQTARTIWLIARHFGDSLEMVSKKFIELQKTH